MIPARDVAARALGDLLHQQPMSEAKVRFAWQSVAGPAIARATVVTISAGRELRVTADSEHWRREIARAAAMLHARLADLLGADRIARITVVTKRHTQ